MPTKTHLEKTHFETSGQNHHSLMLNNHPSMSRRVTDQHLSIPSSPPASPSHSLMTTSSGSTNHSHFQILQLNCFNKQETVHEILQLDDVDMLLLQEPWINPFTHKVLTHPMWHDITPYDHIPTDLTSKFRSCIYIAKRHPIQNISILPSGNTFITAGELVPEHVTTPKLRVMSLYNRPSTNEGLPLLKDWLDQHLDRCVPTIIGMDANLHHTQWNPPRRTNTHPAARDLIRTCGTAGFKLISERGVPTFYPRKNGSPSTIDLTWGNWAATKQKIMCKTLTHTFGSDHQALQIQIPRTTTREYSTRNTAQVAKLNQATYQLLVENQLSTMNSTFDTKEQAMTGIKQLTNVLTTAFFAQGKVVKNDVHKQKAWWDEKKLRPLIKTRNRARRWMTQSQLPEAEMLLGMAKICKV